MTVDVDISLAAASWSTLTGVEGLVERSVAAAADAAGLEPARDAEVSVLLCDDAAIRTFNRTWRGQDKTTNVLSFPAVPTPGAVGPRLLGDIAVAFETTQREAAAEGKTLDAHLSHLIVHGMLHLLAHDHETESEAVVMEALERRILGSLGFADPYAATEPARAAAS